MWRSNLCANVEVLDTISRRISALRLTSDTVELLLHEGNDANTQEFAEQLHVIDNNSG